MRRSALIVPGLALALSCLLSPVASADDVEQVVNLAFGESAVVELLVGSGPHLIALHSASYGGYGYTARGGPPGMVLRRNGTLVYTPRSDDVGVWDVKIKRGTKLVGVVELRVRGARSAGRPVWEPGDERDPLAEASDEPSAPPPEGEVDGRALVLAFGAAEGAFLGGVVGYVIGDASEADRGRSNGATIGTLVGGATGASVAAVVKVIRPDWEPTGDDMALVASSSALGAFAATQVARMAIPLSADDDQRRIPLAGALGSIAGTGLGAALSSHSPRAEILLHTDLGAMIGWQAAAGASDMAGLHPVQDRRVRAPLALGGAAVMGGTSGLLHALGAPAPNPELTTLSLVHGAWMGAWAPRMFTRSPDVLETTGGLRVGLGAGWLIAQALAPAHRPDVKSAALQTLGIAAGSALGAGIPLSLGVDPRLKIVEARKMIGPMLAGGVAGQVLGAAVAPHFDVTANDAAFLTVMGAWTGYQTVGWTVVAHAVDADPQVQAGYALVSAGSGALLSTALVPLIEVTPAESMLSASVGGWGTFFAGWTGHLADMDREDRWAMMLAAGNVGLIGTALLSAGPVHADWADVGLIDGLGLLGGATGALCGIVASPEVDPAGWGAMAGAGVGLGVGTILAARSGRKGGKVADWMPQLPVHLPVKAKLGVQPWTDADGNPGVWVDLDLLDVARK